MVSMPDITIPPKRPVSPVTQSTIRPAPVPAAAVMGEPVRLKFKNKKNRRKLWMGVIVAGLVLLLFTLWNGYQVKRLYSAGVAAQESYTAVAKAVKDNDYAKAKLEIANGQLAVQQARSASGGLWMVKWFPGIHKQFVAVDHVLTAADYASNAGGPLLNLAEQLNDVIGDKKVTVGNISREDRVALLKTLQASPDELEGAQADLQSALAELHEIPDTGLVGPLQVVSDLINSNLPTLQAAVDKGIPFLAVAPTIAGYPAEQSYLFLLQNNTELRPTGGFIGTYGILKLKDADIKEFKTDNIYNVDDKVKDTWPEVKPEPMRRYLNGAPYYLRDANWDPDFPTTSRTAMDFYTRESGDQQDLEGVIAVTPTVIHDLLDMTGPVEVDGDIYDADNFTDLLQYQVEVGYAQEGISTSARKDVINKLATTLMDRVMNLPKDQWGDLLNVLLTNLEEKQILLYSTNEQVDELVRNIGWDGALTQTTSDFVMVVDANMAAYKTDRVMDKNITYTVKPEGDDLVATLTMKYKNNGTFDAFTTRYRSYTRIYVPAGSELLSSSGFLTDDRYMGGDATEAITQDGLEHGKTVFAGFMSVEPKTEDTMTLTYRLPKSVQAEAAKGNYQLYWQKQPGTNNVTATADIDLGQGISQATALDETLNLANNKVHFSTLLERDLIIDVLTK